MEVLVIVLMNVIPAALAMRKGYSFFCWCLAGILGLIVLAFLPFVDRGDTDTRMRKRRRAGNITGLVLSLPSIAIFILQRMGRI